MKINELKKKKIAILGLGLENYFLLKYLLTNKIDCSITICDLRSKEQLDAKYLEFSQLGVEWKLEEDFNQNLGVFDILFRSPGWPIACPGVQRSLEKGKLVYSAMNLFFDLCISKNIIGVTGTKGKGTTSSLIVAILKEAHKTVWLGGNIGVAPFEFIDKVQKNDWIVLELSSFQLEDLRQSPHIAVITNFSEEHLAPADPHNPNFHKTLKSYWLAKSNIFIHQKKNDYLIINKKFATAEIKPVEINGQIILFDKSVLLSKLPGEHNRENVAAAVEVAKILKIADQDVERAVKNFQGLEHRIEKVAQINEITYYDDSFATTPDSAIIALKSFATAVVLLAGGADKGARFEDFVQEINKRVKFLILFQGEGSVRIIEELAKIDFSKKKYAIVDNMTRAVELANEKAMGGDVVLLSPGCASFGVFKNYKERGDLFKFEVVK